MSIFFVGSYVSHSVELFWIIAIYLFADWELCELSFCLMVSAFEEFLVWWLIELVLCVLPVPVEEAVVGDLDLMPWIQGTISMLQAYLHVLMKKIFRNIFQERERYVSSFSGGRASVFSCLLYFYFKYWDSKEILLHYELMLSLRLVTGSGMPASARSSHTGVSRFWVCHNGASGWCWEMHQVPQPLNSWGANDHCRESKLVVNQCFWVLFC